MIKLSPLKVAAVALLALLAWASVSERLDLRGRVDVEAGLQRSLLAFGVARGINAIISVVQGSEVALQPAGLGITLTVGEVLDPVNDLVERFSWVMLAASVSFALQGILLDVGAWSGFALGCAAVFLAAAAALCLSHPRIVRWRALVLRAAVVLAIVRFAVPAAAIANEQIFDRLLSSRFDGAHTSISQVHTDLEALEQRRPGTITGPSFDRADGWTDKVGSFLDAVAATVDVRANWEREKAAYTRAVEAMTSSVIELIAVFVVQTMILPLVFVVAVWAGLKAALRSR